MSPTPDEIERRLNELERERSESRSIAEVFALAHAELAADEDTESSK